MSHTGEDSIDAKSVLDQTVADAYPRASLSRQRSDSEEKDANTPAQSRRKAQNRAACVTFSFRPSAMRCRGLNSVADRELSGNERRNT